MASRSSHTAKQPKQIWTSDMDGLLSIIVATWVIGAWLTHVITCIQAAKWVFLLAGAVFFPIGCVHGTGIWFGFF